MDAGSLLKAVMGPVEFKICLSFGGWCPMTIIAHILFLYSNKRVLAIFHSERLSEGSISYSRERQRLSNKGLICRTLCYVHSNRFRKKMYLIFDHLANPI